LNVALIKLSSKIQWIPTKSSLAWEKGYIDLILKYYQRKIIFYNTFFIGVAGVIPVIIENA